MAPAGQARIEGGVFVNDYVRRGRRLEDRRRRTTIPHSTAPTTTGWTNWGGGDLPVVPYHFTVDSAGIPIPPATGTAPESKATLAALQKRVDPLNDEDRIRNLQSAYGFYEDRKMWDDVVDLFADDGVVEIGGQGVWRGKAGFAAGSRRWARRGSATASSTIGSSSTSPSTIAPGGNEAWARGIELGMLGEADQEKGWWEVATFSNRFVKEGGVWKIRELRRFPLMKTDIFQGWGKSRMPGPGADVPDAAAPSVPGMPACAQPVQECVLAGNARAAAITASRRPGGGSRTLGGAFDGVHECVRRLWPLPRRLDTRPASSASWRPKGSRRAHRLLRDAGQQHQGARQGDSADDARRHFLSLAGPAGGADL